jgi:Flp pilus assembly protein TadB
MSVSTTDCKLYDKAAKRSIAWKNAFLVTGLFLVLGSPLLYKALGNLLMGLKGKGNDRNDRRNSPMVRDLLDMDALQATLKENINALTPEFKSKAVQSLGGVKISVLQHLVHSFLAGLITWLVTYYSMSPDEDRESCVKAASSGPQ